MKNPVAVPETIPLSSILPTEPLLLMGAGPVPIPPAVADANGLIINHLGQTMNVVIERVKTMAQYVFQTASNNIFGIAGPSSAAMEMAVTNLLWEGRKILVLNIGTFSKRFGEMAEAVGAECHYLEPEGLQPIPADMVEEILKREQFDVVTMVQGETSCGIHNTELPQIVKLVKAHGALAVVDAVCTLTTMPLDMDGWDIDVVVTGGQKGLSSIPGVSLIAFSEDAWRQIESRPTSCPHWCLDARRARKFWQFQQYHYTAPVPGILALHEALRIICEETLPQRFERHEMSSLALQAGIEAMGLRLFIPKAYRLNSVVAIDIPKGIDSHDMRSYMTKTFHVEISGAFGLNIVRIGQMGEQCRSYNLFRVLYAMGMSFKHFGVSLNISKGMGLLEENLVKDEKHFVR
ncbi:alanine--glyoxylate aminotransferase [candidate division KSB3 bacterium]|uniref:Alanine--glyoxylate aminotransferase n=1 Tax=candidate division KSB3 bacterium TaxID=2044937 RepID=A0A2G6KKE0_9BACT|nr:MAG: alanine--glyoxylate aminotransferase [candidate division KSB3 bacterium]